MDVARVEAARDYFREQLGLNLFSELSQVYKNYGKKRVALRTIRIMSIGNYVTSVCV